MFAALGNGTGNLSELFESFSMLVSQLEALLLGCSDRFRDFIQQTLLLLGDLFILLAEALLSSTFAEELDIN